MLYYRFIKMAFLNPVLPMGSTILTANAFSCCNYVYARHAGYDNVHHNVSQTAITRRMSGNRKKN